MELNEHLTEVEIAGEIRYLDPDLHADKIGEDPGTVVGICITLLTGLTGALTYIYLHMRAL